MRGIKLKSYKNFTKNSKIISYDKPKHVYIPLICYNDINFDVKISIGSNVKIGTVLAINKEYEMPVHSSVSGIVVGFEKKYIYSGKLVETIKIENNFKNEYELNEEVEKIDKYTKKDFVQLLKDCNIKGMGGADFPTYLKYNGRKRIKNLIINGMECEPYATADDAIIREKTVNILEAIDAIMSINKIDNAYIAISKKNTVSSNALNKVMGSYPKIKLVLLNEKYPLGWSKLLVKSILNKEYDKIPNEIDTVVNNVSTIYAIYEALKYKRPINKRIITLSGNGFKKNTNVEVLIGQNIEEVIEDIGYYKSKMLFIAGGPMMGSSIVKTDFVITSNLSCILGMKDIKNDEVTTCHRCGKCASVCPAKLAPILIKENISDVGELKKLNADRCIGCGLCSYMCPAKMPLRESVLIAKKNVRDAK